MDKKQIKSIHPMSVNDKLYRFIELCQKSRSGGLNTAEITERKKILDDFLDSGIMVFKDNCHYFVDDEHDKIFENAFKQTT